MFEDFAQGRLDRGAVLRRDERERAHGRDLESGISRRGLHARVPAEHLAVSRDEEEGPGKALDHGVGELPFPGEPFLGLFRPLNGLEPLDAGRGLAARFQSRHGECREVLQGRALRGLETARHAIGHAQRPHDVPVRRHQGYGANEPQPGPRHDQRVLAPGRLTRILDLHRGRGGFCLKEDPARPRKLGERDSRARLDPFALAVMESKPRHLCVHGLLRSPHQIVENGLGGRAEYAIAGQSLESFLLPCRQPRRQVRPQSPMTHTTGA